MAGVLQGFKNQLRNVDTAGLRFRLVDAQHEVLGRLASQLAVILQGKDKPTYDPARDRGDVVIVINARHVTLTGNKLRDKVYRWHTGYPGGIKERNVADQLQRKPEEVLRLAVTRMLPRNKLWHDRCRKLNVFPDAAHPFIGHAKLLPFVMPPRTVRIKHQDWSDPSIDWEGAWREAAGEDYAGLRPIPEYDAAIHGPLPGAPGP